MNMDLRKAFSMQKIKAKHRGIEFLMTFEEWYKIWLDSGHISERGNKKGQYVMARFGDQGPYAVGNVRIVPVAINQNEAHIGRIVSEDTRSLIGLATSKRVGWKHTEETKRKISAAKIGHAPSKEAKENMSKAALAVDKRLRNTSGLVRTGAVLTEETKRKISESTKGRAAPNLGKPHSEETKRKIAEAAKRRYARV